MTFENMAQEPSKPSIRTRLVQATMELAHRQGFGKTTLAEIAKAAKVPPGNLYYYFKTKDEIAEAMVEQRLAMLQVAQQELGKLADPRERLGQLIALWLEDRAALVKYGCPVGTFCTELNKDGGRAAQKASQIFADLLAWVEVQFREFCPKSEARGHAAHLLSVLEGVTVVSSSVKDPELIMAESKRMVGWIRSL